MIKSTGHRQMKGLRFLVQEKEVAKGCRAHSLFNSLNLSPYVIKS